MISRRSFLQMSLMTVGLSSTELAFAGDDDVIPLLNNRADFANAWTNIDVGLGLSTFVAPSLKDEHVQALSLITIRHPLEVDNFFQEKVGSPFITWFNSVAGRLPYWSRKKILGDDAQTNLYKFWSSYTEFRKPTMLEFITYMAVFINEAGGNLKSVDEQVNPLTNPNHPGISYLFDAFEVASPTGRWRKKSYNGFLNQNCLQLFDDLSFTNTFRSEPYANVLAGTNNTIWRGEKYPTANFPVSADPRVTGIILECDFYKFRGRGLIQTTWRENYRTLVRFIKSYRGASPVLIRFRDSWKGSSDDEVLTNSSNADWDDIFAEPCRDVLTYAVWSHASSVRYVPLSKLADVVNGTSRGSIAFFGDRLGGIGYGERLKAKVGSMLESMLG